MSASNTAFLLGFDSNRGLVPSSWKLAITALFWSSAGRRWILWDMYVGGLAAWSAFNLTPYGRQPHGFAVGVVFGLIMGLACWLCGVPRPESNTSRYELVTISFIGALLGVALCMFAGLAVAYLKIGRWIWSLFALFSFVGILAPRLVVGLVESAARYRVLLYGAGAAGRTAIREFRQHPAITVVGVLDDNRNIWSSMVEGVPCLGGMRQAEKVCRQWNVQLVAPAIRAGMPEAAMRNLLRLRHFGIEILGLPELYERFLGHVPLDHVTAAWIASGQFINPRSLVMLTKRMSDLTLSLAALLISLPLWPLLALLIKLDSPGPVFFQQWRMGKNSHPFMILKFRTMLTDAEKNGAQWAGLRDTRITRLGRILRLTRLDELPQLLNVIAGHMSLVGPRPERPEFVGEIEKQVPFYSQRYLALPGLTGWAQVRYRYGSGIEDAKRKLEYDLYYMRHVSFRLDLQILLRTIPLLMKGSR